MKRPLATAALGLMILLATGFASAAADEPEQGVGIDYARSLRPYLGPVGANPNWGGDYPGEFNYAAGYFGTAGYWAPGGWGGFYFWDGGGPKYPPLHALHGGMWWWQSGLHPYVLYDQVMARRNGVAPPETRAGVDERSAVIALRVPADARVSINDRPTTSTGSYRRFVSRNLEPGRPYVYVVRVELTRQGETLTETQVIETTSGRHAQLAFTFDPRPRSIAQAR